MVRQLRTVLASLGHAVDIVARPRTHVHAPDGAGFEALKVQAHAIEAALAGNWRTETEAPALWLTYHNYHKAPDLLGPAMSRRLGVPYVLVEASHAGSLLAGPWGVRMQAALEASLRADLHFHLTAQDRDGLLEGGVDPAALEKLSPFIDTIGFTQLPRRHAGSGSLRLVSVAMMRSGGKLASYGELARMLRLLRERRPEIGWHLTLVGDGPERQAVEALFCPFGDDRIRFAGLVPGDDLPVLLASHDLFVWPGLHEPFGLVYLEAQAAGLPVVAYDSGGVADTVIAGETALLVEEGDADALAVAIAQLADDRGRLAAMANAAAGFVQRERGLEHAAHVIAAGLARAGERHAARPRHGRETQPVPAS